MEKGRPNGATGADRLLLECLALLRQPRRERPRRLLPLGVAGESPQGGRSGCRARETRSLLSRFRRRRWWSRGGGWAGKEERRRAVQSWDRSVAPKRIPRSETPVNRECRCVPRRLRRPRAKRESPAGDPAVVKGWLLPLTCRRWRKHG